MVVENLSVTVLTETLLFQGRRLLCFRYLYPLLTVLFDYSCVKPVVKASLARLFPMGL